MVFFYIGSVFKQPFEIAFSFAIRYVEKAANICYNLMNKFDI